jgi:hypothetical protein
VNKIVLRLSFSREKSGLLSSILYCKKLRMCWTVFTTVYRVVPRLSFSSEESGLMASILSHHKHCILGYMRGGMAFFL